MAEQNLLTSSFNGTVGTMTGVKWKNKRVVKQRIWSKTPNSKLGTNSLRAFEALNRVASAMSKKWWYKLGLKANGMHKHNAVAHFLKPAIKNHIFQPYNLEEVFEVDGSCGVYEQQLNRETGFLTFHAATTLDITENSNSSWLVLVCSQKGKVFYCESPKVTIINPAFYIPIAADDTVYILTFAVTKEEKKYKYHGFFVSPYVILGVLYTSRFLNSTWEYVEENTARGTGVSLSVENSILHAGN